MAPLIELQDVTKYYRKYCALRNVTAAIPAGVTGLLGPNGAGKSTLIKVLLGLVKLSSGSAKVLGHSLPRERFSIRSKIGFMPEDDCYFAGLSGVESVRFLARLSGIPSCEALRRAHEILDFCDMGQERYRDVETYSTGMRQKVKFAASMVHDPVLLILDEPTAGLDPEERDRMLTRIKSLSHDAGKSILISTHILPDVQATCDHVAVMAEGQIRLLERLDLLSRPSEPAMQLRTLGGSDALLAVIQRAGYAATVDEMGMVTVRAADERFLARIWDWAREANVTLKSLTPAQNSLEQIFLACVREASRAGI
ncbi:MAG: ABC transporter ATP-binding protein [Planctomycetes bacterium]|nr:ABC transporter ATP-binding protein [Planctomycetota bacterium]